LNKISTFRFNEDSIVKFRELSKQLNLTNSELFEYMLVEFLNKVDKLTLNKIKVKYSSKCNKMQQHDTWNVLEDVV